MSSALKNLYIAPSRRLLKLLARTKLSEETFIIILAFLIGIIVGLIAIGFRELIEQVSYFFFPGSGTIQENIANTKWYYKILLPVAGGLLIAPIYYYFSPESQGQSFYKVLTSILFKGGKMNPRIIITKTIVTSLTIGSGGSVGRETPIIQVGAGIGSTIGQIFKLSGSRLKTVVACGAAAGISAVFNAPIAGAVFVVEILILDIAFSQFTAIITASLMGAITSQFFSGNFSGFNIPVFTFTSYYELFFYFVLGIFCGLLSYGLIKIMFLGDVLFNQKIKIHPLLKPALGGLIIGAIGVFYPQVMGIGYDTINELFKNQNIIWYTLIILILLKGFASSISLGSGGSGGSISPVIFMGAMTGYLFGMGVNYLFPSLNTSPLNFALVGISGFISGATRAPITAIIILFELSGNILIVIPLFITTVTGYILSSKICSQSIFTFKLALENKDIRHGLDINTIKKVKIKDVYSPNFDTIFLNDNFNFILSKILRSKNTDFPVVDSRGIVKGMILSNDLRGSVEERETLQQLLIAGDIAIADFRNLSVDDNCFTALNMMNKFDLEGLPVVDNISKRIIGIVWKKDIIMAYFKKIDSDELAINLSENLNYKKEYESLRFKVGFSITEIVPPLFIVGKNIESINLYSKYGLDLLAVKTNTKTEFQITPNPEKDFIIKENDSLVVAGEVRNIQKFISSIG